MPRLMFSLATRQASLFCSLKSSAIKTQSFRSKVPHFCIALLKILPSGIVDTLHRFQRVCQTVFEFK